MPNERKALPHITPANAPPPYDEKDGNYEYFQRSRGRVESLTPPEAVTSR
jgi:hypothetical protein